MLSLLKVDNLTVKYRGTNNNEALHKVSFNLYKGEILGIVGESGSGKTTLASAILNILAQDIRKQGKITFQGKDVFNLNEKKLVSLRGQDIGIIFQEPAASFDPVFTIGYQLKEFLKQKMGKENLSNMDKEIDINLKRVGLLEYRRILKSYPHQLSGGQLQRVMIAMVISTNPALLIADEPTSSLEIGRAHV